MHWLIGFPTNSSRTTFPKDKCVAGIFSLRPRFLKPAVWLHLKSSAEHSLARLSWYNYLCLPHVLDLMEFLLGLFFLLPATPFCLSVPYDLQKWWVT